MTTRDFHADDLAAIAADDALVELLAAGSAIETVTDDELADVLAGWRAELDLAAAASGYDERAPRRRTVAWLRRHTAAATVATLVTVAASTGVAAAAGGAHGPLGGLHRALFGTPGPTRHDDATTLAVTRMLDAVAAALDTARGVGGVTAAQRADLGDRLDTADRLIAGGPGIASGLSARATKLRDELAALDTLPTPVPDVGGGIRLGTDHHGGSVSTGDGSDDRNGSGSDGSGETSGDGGSTGSDDGGSVSGDGGSGGTDDGAVSGGASGSDGGSVSGGGTSDGGSSGGGTSDGGTTGGDVSSGD